MFDFLCGHRDALSLSEINRDLAVLLPKSTLVSVDTGHVPFR